MDSSAIPQRGRGTGLGNRGLLPPPDVSPFGHYWLPYALEHL